MTLICENSSLRNNWFVVALCDDIGEQPQAVTLLGEKFVLWRTGDAGIVAAADRCPHREAPLSVGTVKDGVLTCRYHGWTFGAQGRCLSVPSAPDSTQVPALAHLRQLEVRERYGMVWLCPGTATQDVPLIAEDADASFRRFNTPVQAWKTSVGRMVDNFMDTSHFAFVHDVSIGQGIDPTVAQFDMVKLDDWFTGYIYDSYIANPEAGQAMNGDSSPTTTVAMTTGFCLPFLIRGTMQFLNGVRQVLMLASTPVDEVNSLFTFAIWRNDDADEREVVDFELTIDAEDQRMLELVGGPLPLEPGTMVSVRSDKGSEVWRREFIKLLAGSPADTGRESGR